MTSDYYWGSTLLCYISLFFGCLDIDEKQTTTEVMRQLLWRSTAAMATTEPWDDEAMMQLFSCSATSSVLRVMVFGFCLGVGTNPPIRWRAAHSQCWSPTVMGRCECKTKDKINCLDLYLYSRLGGYKGGLYRREQWRWWKTYRV